MGEIFRFKNLVFRIWSDDHNPPHVHVEGPDISAKFTIKNCKLMEGYGLSTKDVRKIIAQIEMRQEKLIAKWEEIHGKN